MLLHHIINGKPVTKPTPRIQKKFSKIMNISSWIWYLNKLDPEESKSFLSNVFKESQWQQHMHNDDLHTYEHFREFVIDEGVVKRQASFVFVPSN